jgi:hypothetical protein
MMHTMPPVKTPLRSACAFSTFLAMLASLAFVMSACQSTKPDADPDKKDDGKPATETAKKDEVKEKVDVGFLLSMSYDEARKISPKSLVVPPFYKIAADEITVLKSDSKGQPQRVRAKGHVFLQIDFREQLQALGQEAYIESGGEIIMRGKPLLKRGRSLVEGLSDYTVFYIKGLRLQVIGSHRMIKGKGAAGSSEAYEGSSSSASLPAWNVSPNWQRSWKDGPNPILPALSPEDIPADMRASPLLPLPEGSDLPQPLPTNEPPPGDKPEMRVPEVPHVEAPPPPVPPAPATPPAPPDKPAQ